MHPNQFLLEVNIAVNIYGLRSSAHAKKEAHFQQPSFCHNEHFVSRILRFLVALSAYISMQAKYDLDSIGREQCIGGWNINFPPYIPFIQGSNYGDR